MSSLLTNTSAMTALQNLATTQKDLNKTQGEISSGLAVANASDNAAYWSIATSMKSDTSALGAVSNALNLGASVLNTATSAMNSVETILKQMKADLVTAQTSGTNPVQVQSDITAQQQSLISVMRSASFNGVNLLDGSDHHDQHRRLLLAHRVGDHQHRHADGQYDQHRPRRSWRDRRRLAGQRDRGWHGNRHGRQHRHGNRRNDRRRHLCQRQPSRASR